MKNKSLFYSSRLVFQEAPPGWKPDCARDVLESDYKKLFEVSEGAQKFFREASQKQWNDYSAKYDRASSHEKAQMEKPLDKHFSSYDYTYKSGDKTYSVRSESGVRAPKTAEESRYPTVEQYKFFSYDMEIYNRLSSLPDRAVVGLYVLVEDQYRELGGCPTDRPSKSNVTIVVHKMVYDKASGKVVIDQEPISNFGALIDSSGQIVDKGNVCARPDTAVRLALELIEAGRNALKQ